MKKLAVSAAVATACMTAHAGPAIMIGIVVPFGGTPGVSLSLLSTNRPDRVALNAGINFFPAQAANRIGFQLGGGYVFNHGAVTLGYDFMNSRMQMGLGAANTRKPPAPAIVAPPPPPAPPAPAPAPVVAPPPPPPPPAPPPPPPPPPPPAPPPPLNT